MCPSHNAPTTEAEILEKPDALEMGLRSAADLYSLARSCAQHAQQQGMFRPWCNPGQRVLPEHAGELPG